MTKTFDVACFALAERFLPDEGEAIKDALARELQSVVDDFLDEIEARKHQQSEAA